MAFTALLDACVLYPVPLRDLKNRPDLTDDQLNRTRLLMNLHAEDNLITGYEVLIPSLHLPDPNDCHVLAAAIKGQCDVIVTFNVKDFPEEALEPFQIETIAPDTFLLNQFDLAPITFLNAVRKHRARLKNPVLDVDTYLATLLKQKLVLTVQRLRAYSQQI